MKVKKIALAACSVVVAAVVAEVCARVHLGGRWEFGVVPRLAWLDVGVREAQRGWAIRPHLAAEVVGPHAPYRAEHDSRGYRQVERSVANPGGALRVLALGDSLVYGWGLAAHERFTDRLEVELTRALARPVEVWNLGIPGYSIDQALWTYELHGRELEADVVLLCVVMNDIPIAETDSFHGLGKPRLVKEAGAWRRVEAPAELVRPRGMPWRKRLSGWSAAVAWLREVQEGPRPSAAAAPPNIPWNEAGGRPIAEAAAKAAAKLLDPEAPVHEALRALAERVRADGAELVLFSAPFGHDPYLTDPRFGAPPEGRVESSLSRAVRTFAAEAGAVGVDVDGDLGREAEQGVLLHVGDGHPNARANELIAARLAPVVSELLKKR